MDRLEKVKAEVEKLHGNPYYMMAVKDVLEIIDMQDEPESDELEDAASRYAKKEYDHKSPATLPDRCRGCYAPLMYAFKDGAKWQKEQMMVKAIEAHCFGFQGAALFSFRLPADNYLVGSEVKVIVIKED